MYIVTGCDGTGRRGGALNARASFFDVRVNLREKWPVCVSLHVLMRECVCVRVGLGVAPSRMCFRVFMRCVISHHTITHSIRSADLDLAT